jgi:hypothetical protein
MRGRIDSGSLEHFSLSFGWGRGVASGGSAARVRGRRGCGRASAAVAQKSRRRSGRRLLYKFRDETGKSGESCTTVPKPYQLVGLLVATSQAEGHRAFRHFHFSRISLLCHRMNKARKVEMRLAITHSHPVCGSGGPPFEPGRRYQSNQWVTAVLAFSVRCQLLKCNDPAMTGLVPVSFADLAGPRLTPPGCLTT